VEGLEVQRRQLRHEVDRDDRLPGARPAGDDERDLLLVLAGRADRIHDRVEGDLLFVEERKDGLVLDHAGDVVEQALVRAEGGVGDSLEDCASVVGADHAGFEKVDQGVAFVAYECGVHRHERREYREVERRLRVVLGVVQVGTPVERDHRVVAERRVRVEGIALVLGDLPRRVEGVARLAAVIDRHAVGDVGAADLGPLLKLDDHGRVAGHWIGAGHQHVEALGRQRELQLDEDPLISQIGVLEDMGHRAEGVAPGRDLGRGGPVAELVEEAVGELVGQPSLDRIRDELLRGALVEVHQVTARAR